MMNRHGLVAGPRHRQDGDPRVLAGQAVQRRRAGLPGRHQGHVSGMAVPGTASDKLLQRPAAIGQSWAPQAFPTESTASAARGRASRCGDRDRVRSGAAVEGAQPHRRTGVVVESDLSLRRQAQPADVDPRPAVVVQLLTSDDGKQQLQELGGCPKVTAGVLLRNSSRSPDAVPTSRRRAPNSRPWTSCVRRRIRAASSRSWSCPASWRSPSCSRRSYVAARRPVPGPARGRRRRQAKLVFFFDEAAPALQGRVEGVRLLDHADVRLIRSKGVGVFFSPRPKDVHADVLASCGKPRPAALRGPYTPDDRKALKADRSSSPGRPTTSRGVDAARHRRGHRDDAEENGAPTPVAWTRLYAPQSVDVGRPARTIEGIVNNSQLYPKYAAAVDRESAYEMLAAPPRRPPARRGRLGPADPAAAVPPPMTDPPRSAPTRRRPSPSRRWREISATRSQVDAAGRRDGGRVGDRRSIFSTSRKR